MAQVVSAMVGTTMTGLSLSAGFSCCSHEAKKLLRSRTSQRSKTASMAWGAHRISKSRPRFPCEHHGEAEHSPKFTRTLMASLSAWGDEAAGRGDRRFRLDPTWAQRGQYGHQAAAHREARSAQRLDHEGRRWA